MFLPTSSDLVVRQLYSAPPPAQNYIQDNPSLLVSWWCTGFALTIILVRICGRYIRTEKLFMEDRIMAWSIIPLLARMAFVHVVLRWGTNNAITTGLSADDIYHREIGSKLVLPARILYASFLWIAKLTISEFLKRLYQGVWKRSYEVGLHVIRWFLLLTFLGVIVATLAECQPFTHYWQVVPDPGPHCRQGYAQLLTMGVTDTITDLVLVCFPIPIVIMSNMRLKRKISLVLLFGLSAILVAITIYRMYGTIQRQSNQQYRSLLASIEILAATAVSNAVVLGSFIRDRGVKKQRFKFGSTGGASALDRPTTAANRTRAAISWGSDEDLVGDLGIRLGPEFSSDKPKVARPAPTVLSLGSPSASMTPAQASWTFENRPRRASVDTDDTDLKNRHASREEEPPSPRDTSVLTPRRMSFFDVGGLLGDDAAPRRRSSISVSVPSSTTYSLRPLISTSANRQRSPRGSRIPLEDMSVGLHERRIMSEPSSSAQNHFPDESHLGSLV
ncbi:hypothetical protein MMC19_002882 [Ptychographa xylographoides]|nr:hypothetical protein [Ptychographa xylographoides]